MKHLYNQNNNELFRYTRMIWGKRGAPEPHPLKDAREMAKSAKSGKEKVKGLSDQIDKLRKTGKFKEVMDKLSKEVEDITKDFDRLKIRLKRYTRYRGKLGAKRLRRIMKSRDYVKADVEELNKDAKKMQERIAYVKRIVDYFRLKHKKAGDTAKKKLVKAAGKGGKATPERGDAKPATGGETKGETAGDPFDDYEKGDFDSPKERAVRPILESISLKDGKFQITDLTTLINTMKDVHMNFPGNYFKIGNLNITKDGKNFYLREQGKDPISSYIINLDQPHYVYKYDKNSPKPKKFPIGKFMDENVKENAKKEFKKQVEKMDSDFTNKFNGIKNRLKGIDNDTLKSQFSTLSNHFVGLKKFLNQIDYAKYLDNPTEYGKTDAITRNVNTFYKLMDLFDDMVHKAINKKFKEFKDTFKVSDTSFKVKDKAKFKTKIKELIQISDVSDAGKANNWPKTIDGVRFTRKFNYIYINMAGANRFDSIVVDGNYPDNIWTFNDQNNLQRNKLDDFS